MRTVVYFCAGTVADFQIPDDKFEDFTKHMDWKRHHGSEDLDKARRVLESFVIGGKETASANEVAAACFVWNFFNTNPDDSRHIDGDVMIVDLEGDGHNVEYASTADVQLAPEN